MTGFPKPSTQLKLFAVLLCLFVRTVHAIEIVDEIEIDTIFENWSRIDSPGAVVGIFQEGEALYLEAYGAANLEHAIPINLDTRFNIASMAKTFTAFVVLLLEEQDQLSLEDDIRLYLPEIYDFGETITIDHLLYHSSGLRNWGTLFALKGISEDDQVRSDDILRLITQQTELQHSPGERATYSNTNYFLLSLIVERVSGKSFREIANENIFAPLGMTNTFFADNPYEIVANRASGHSVLGSDLYELDSPQHNDVGASNLLISMNDFARWEENLASPEVGSQRLLEKLYTRERLNSGKLSNYARGTGYGSFGGLALRGMSGGEPGFRSTRSHFIDSKLSIVIFTNATFDVFTPFSQIANLYLHKDFASQEFESAASSDNTIRIPIEVIEDLAGPYRELGSHNVLTAYADTENGSIAISGLSQFYRMKPISNRKFESQISSDETQVEFDTNPPSNIELIQNGAVVFRGVKILNVDSSAPYNEQFVGTYYSDELESSFEIELRGNDLYRTKPEMPDRLLQGQYEDLFEAEGGTGTMLFSRNADKVVTEFRLSVANIFNVLFRKI